MGWFDGASSLGGTTKVSRGHSPARSTRSGRSSRHGKHSGHSDYHKEKKSKLTTGSTFGDWAAGVNRTGKNKSSRSVVSEGGRDRYATSHIDVVEPPRERERGIFDGHKNRSTASFFSVGSSRSPTSYYSRSPRKGFLARCYKKLKHLLKKMKRYMKSHPLKVFMLVIMPLLSGGILTGLLARFGIRLPHGIEKFIAKISGKPTYKDFLGVGMSAMGTGVGRDRYGEPQFERKRGGGGALDSFGGIGGVMDGVGGIMSVAKMFI